MKRRNPTTTLLLLDNCDWCRHQGKRYGIRTNRRAAGYPRETEDNAILDIDCFFARWESGLLCQQINSAEPNIFHQKSQIRSSLHASGTNAKLIRFLWHNLNQVPQNSMQNSQCWSLIHPYVRPRSSILAWPIATPNKTNMDLACTIAACFPWYWTFCFVPFHSWFHPSFGNVRVARCIRHDQEFLGPSKMQADGPGRMQWSHAN